MPVVSFNDDSLSRHNVSHSEVLEVLADDFTRAIEFGESRQGNSTVIYIGHTIKERLLEIGVEFLGEEAEHIYHAKSATSKYAGLYKKWRY